MQMSLEKILNESVQSINEIAPNLFIAIRSQSMVKILHFIEQTPEANYADRELRKILSKSCWATNPQKLEEFFQLIGEVQFWMLADEKGVKLARIPKASHKTPDFQFFNSGSVSLQFEVKTLSVRNGTYALEAMSEDSRKSQIELKKQVSRGAQVAMQAHSVAPHGAIPRGLQQTTICQNLIDKARNNIKRGQYAAAPTFLVLNLILIDGHNTGNADLRPVAHGYPNESSVRTGAMWTLAFGTLGQLVHSVPEYEGLPCIEGRLGRDGILVNPDFESLAGLILVVHSLSEAPALYGLIRRADRESWDSTYPVIGRAFYALVGTNWNDDLDTNGWQLIDH
jgi:hypothetical protein